MDVNFAHRSLLLLGKFSRVLVVREQGPEVRAAGGHDVPLHLEGFVAAADAGVTEEATLPKLVQHLAHPVLISPLLRHLLLQHQRRRATLRHDLHLEPVNSNNRVVGRGLEMQLQRLASVRTSSGQQSLTLWQESLHCEGNRRVGESRRVSRVVSVISPSR